MDTDVLTGLREVTDGDADALVALVGGVFAEYPGCVLDLDDLDADLLAPASTYAAVDATLWVVEDGHEVVACVGLGWDDEDAAVAELKRLYVRADHRGRGLGGALVEHVHAEARRRGATRIVLWSDTRFHDGHRRYEAAGYRRSGVTRDLHDPSHTTEDRFERDLP